MNYRHLYHAGNFSDVMKHVLLIGLATAFLKKEKAWAYIDTHAGVGIYDLHSACAKKTDEHQDGITKLNAATKPSSCEWIQRYLEIIREVNFAGPLQYYPGSPAIVRALLRPQDHMILSELHPEDYRELKENFSDDVAVSIHHMDAYTLLKACLPPKSRRGLILIDPPFEDPLEFKKIIAGLEQAFTRFATGVYAIWYPIKDRDRVEGFYRALTRFKKPLFKVEIRLKNPSDKLSECGLAVLNPPFGFSALCQTQVMPYLAEMLSFDYRCHEE